MISVNHHDERKYVFAHVIVGNTYPYSVEDWAQDIELANKHEIDGFVLNVGADRWQKDRVGDCFAAASRAEHSSFRLFMSFDMSAIPSNRLEDVELLKDYMRSFGQHRNMYHRAGKVVVSTFAGENSLFGHHDMDSAWDFVKRALQEIVPVYFIPSFFIDPRRYQHMQYLDGAFNWNGGWPLQLNPSLPRAQVQNAPLDTDWIHLRNLGGRFFMAAVSPWFFTHYGPDTWNKNWIYRADDWLFVRRWEQLIRERNKIDIVQMISWNDFGESHYMGPIKGAQPNSQAWVDGYPHTGWLHLNSYFARAFKDGYYPTVERDQIFMWARPHPKDASSPDHVPRPKNWELTDDTFWVVVLAKAPGQVTLSAGNDLKKSFSVHAGHTKLCHPLEVKKGMRAVLTRGGGVVAECNPHEYQFMKEPPVYNFNAFVAMS